MPVIAPWLTANNPLEYMKAGAGLGLEQRGQSINMADAANRLRFSYDQLSANQDMERRRMQQEAVATSAADELRQNGIQVAIVGEETTPENAVAKYLAGELETGEGFCRCHE